MHDTFSGTAHASITTENWDAKASQFIQWNTFALRLYVYQNWQRWINSTVCYYSNPPSLTAMCTLHVFHLMHRLHYTVLCAICTFQVIWKCVISLKCELFKQNYACQESNTTQLKHSNSPNLSLISHQTGTTLTTSSAEIHWTMKMSRTFVTALLAALFALTHASPLSECKPGCKFEMVGGRITYSLPPEGNAWFTGTINLKQEYLDDNRAVGIVSSTGVPHFFTGRHAYPITNLGQSQLDVPFPQDFFKATSSVGSRSGIMHTGLKGDQKKYLDNVCWILPIRSYQLLERSTGHVVENVNIEEKDKFKECIAFRTRVYF